MDPMEKAAGRRVVRLGRRQDTAAQNLDAKLVFLTHAIVDATTTFLPGTIKLPAPTSVPDSSPTVLPPDSVVAPISSALPPAPTSEPVQTSTPPTTLATRTSQIVATSDSISSSVLADITSASEILPSSVQLAPSAATTSLGLQDGAAEKVPAEDQVGQSTAPQTNRAMAIGIAFGAVAGFAGLVIVGIVFYKLKQKRKPKYGMKQFQ